MSAPQACPQLSPLHPASVVVTGASSGLGAATAHYLASSGWRVVAVGRSRVRLEEVVASIAAFAGAGTCVGVLGDVAERATHTAALHAALDLAPLGGWVNCAGITHRNALTELDAAATQEMVQANQMGTLWGCQVAVEHLVCEQTPGAIVNMSSVHGLVSYPDHPVYEMTKAAIIALTRSVAVSYGGRGIRCNAVAPGAIRTPALDATFASAPDAAASEAELAGRSPAGRIGEANEVAGVIAFLLSPVASYVSGQVVAIDGGWTATLGLDPADPAAQRQDVAPGATR